MESPMEIEYTDADAKPKSDESFIITAELNDYILKKENLDMFALNDLKAKYNIGIHKEDNINFTTMDELRKKLSTELNFKFDSFDQLITQEEFNKIYNNNVIEKIVQDYKQIASNVEEQMKVNDESNDLGLKYTRKQIDKMELIRRKKENKENCGIQQFCKKENLDDNDLWEKQIEYVPLPTNWQQVITHVLRTKSNEEIIKETHCSLMDLSCLFTANDKNLYPWLNDNIINEYLDLIIKRGQTSSYKSKIFTFNTRFYGKLCQENGVSSVQRWSGKKNIFEMDFVLVPLHINNNHWMMMAIYMQHKKIVIYDSLIRCDGTPDKISQPYLSMFDNITKYLAHEMKRKCNGKEFDISSWDCHLITGHPKQENKQDCGVFSLMYAEGITRGLTKINFNQTKMPGFRSQILYEIITQKLINS